MALLIAFEKDFHDCSFGFRPNRSAQDAVERIAGKVKKGEVLVYDADLSSYFDTIPHDKLMAAVQMRITDGSVLRLIRQWLKVCVQEPNGVRKSPKGRGTPQGGVISPLLANIYLHWFETIVSLTAKACGQVMSIVRYADDFVILARVRQREDTWNHSREERSIDCQEGRGTAQQIGEGMGGVLLGRLSVQGFSRGERLRASAHGSAPQPQKPAAVSA